MFTGFHSIWARWTNQSSQLFNVHGVSDVMQTEIHAAEPLVPELSAFEVEMAIEKLKKHKSPGSDQIPAELIKARSRTIYSEIHKLINSIWSKKGDKTDCSKSNYKVYAYIVKHNYILGGMLFTCTIGKAQLHVLARNVGHLQVVQ